APPTPLSIPQASATVLLPKPIPTVAAGTAALEQKEEKSTTTTNADGQDDFNTYDTQSEYGQSDDMDRGTCMCGKSLREGEYQMVCDGKTCPLKDKVNGWYSGQCFDNNCKTNCGRYHPDRDTNAVFACVYCRHVDHIFDF